MEIKEDISPTYQSKINGPRILPKCS